MVRKRNNSSPPLLMLFPQHVPVMPYDDGRIIETCCGNNIGGGGEELLRLRTINWLM
jgi:hypothetical protein